MHAQMVAIGSLCLMVACGCFGQVSRVASARVCAYMQVCARVRVYACVRGCVQLCARVRTCVQGVC